MQYHCQRNKEQQKIYCYKRHCLLYIQGVLGCSTAVFYWTDPSKMCIKILKCSEIRINKFRTSVTVQMWEAKELCICVNSLKGSSVQWGKILGWRSFEYHTLFYFRNNRKEKVPELDDEKSPGFYACLENGSFFCIVPNSWNLSSAKVSFVIGLISFIMKLNNVAGSHRIVRIWGKFPL